MVQEWVANKLVTRMEVKKNDSFFGNFPTKDINKNFDCEVRISPRDQTENNPYDTTMTFNDGVVSQPTKFGFDIEIYTNTELYRLMRACQMSKTKFRIVTQENDAATASDSFKIFKEEYKEVLIVESNYDVEANEMPIAKFSCIALNKSFTTKTSDTVIITNTEDFGQRVDHPYADVAGSKYEILTDDNEWAT